MSGTIFATDSGAASAASAASPMVSSASLSAAEAAASFKAASASMAAAEAADRNNAPIPAFDEDRLRLQAHHEVAKVLEAESAAAAAALLEGDSDDGAPGPSKKRKLTMEERANQNRVRNREHARNTRMRKKAYVSKLKELVIELANRKETEAAARKAEAERLAATQHHRHRALSTFLHYRTAGCLTPTLWEPLIDDAFVLHYPVTPYLGTHASPQLDQKTEVTGLKGLIADTAAFALMTRQIGHGRAPWSQKYVSGARVQMVYEVIQENVLLQGDTLFCKYLLRTTNAVECGAAKEIAQHGMIECKFTENDKIERMEMVYDVMSFMQLLRRAAGARAEIPIVPATLEHAVAHSTEARVITTATSPFRIVYVNQAWTELCGFKSSEAVGGSLRMLQGPATDMGAIHQLMGEIGRGHAAAATLTNQRKDGTLFKNHLRVFPLVGAPDGKDPPQALHEARAATGDHPVRESPSSPDGVITHFLGVLEALPDGVPAATPGSDERMGVANPDDASGCSGAYASSSDWSSFGPSSSGSDGDGSMRSASFGEDARGGSPTSPAPRSPGGQEV